MEEDIIKENVESPIDESILEQQKEIDVEEKPEKDPNKILTEAIAVKRPLGNAAPRPKSASQLQVTEEEKSPSQSTIPSFKDSLNLAQETSKKESVVKKESKTENKPTFEEAIQEVTSQKKIELKLSPEVSSDTFVLEGDQNLGYEDETLDPDEDKDEITLGDIEDVYISKLDPNKIEDDSVITEKKEVFIDTVGEKFALELTEKPPADIEEGKKILENRLAKRTGTEIHGYGIDNILSSVASVNEALTKLKNYDIPLEKIVAINSDEESTHQAFLKQYQSPTHSPIIAPRISRFPVLLSGYYAEMRNYTYGEHTSVVKNATNPDLKFVNRITEEFISLYKHITWTSLTPDAKNPLTFDRWAEETLFPDLEQFYYGAFDATYPGETPYHITCGNSSCGHEFVINKTNKELNYVLQTGLKPSFIRDILLEKIPVAELKSLKLYKEAHALYEDKVLPQIHFRVSYGVPSIRDILEWLEAFDTMLSEEFEDYNALTDPQVNRNDHNILKLFTYIKKLTVPVNMGKNENGKEVLRFYCIDTTVSDAKKRNDNRIQILSLLKDLDKDIFRELFTGKEVAEKVRLIGIKHMITNITCPNCGTNLVRIPIDMGPTFFTEAARSLQIISMY